LWVYALTVVGIRFNVVIDKQFGSIIDIHLEYNVILYVMRNLMEMVLQFREVIQCNVWESLIAYVTWMTVDILILCKGHDSKE
jgi:hypothetical protein